tara:strand:+ start:603 stop:824 length:222 start_codon:yes stop_codon:yes gene_type:complete
MVLGFLLVVYIDNKELDINGVAAFRDIHRCAYFAIEIEKTGHVYTYKNNYYRSSKIKAHCEPRFFSKETKFWD